MLHELISLLEEHLLKVLGNEAPRRIFGRKRDESLGGMVFDMRVLLNKN
jgi:hypothetical protein